MAKLSNAHKELIIKALACYHSPSEAIELLKKDYGVTVDFNQVSFYNVGSLSSARLADHWRELFHKTRENYISEAKAVPIANKGYRLGELQKIYDSFVSEKKYGSAARILEQASVEMGSDGDSDEGRNRTRDVNLYLQQINQKIINSGVLDD